MRNASGHRGENKRRWIKKVNKNIASLLLENGEL